MSHHPANNQKNFKGIYWFFSDLFSDWQQITWTYKFCWTISINKKINSSLILLTNLEEMRKMYLICDKNNKSGSGFNEQQRELTTISNCYLLGTAWFKTAFNQERNALQNKICISLKENTITTRKQTTTASWSGFTKRNVQAWWKQNVKQS